jgi:hypothetical protein
MELMTRGTSGYAKKKKEETQEQFARRLTHLYLENKGITEVVRRYPLLTSKLLCVCVFLLQVLSAV